MNGLQALLTVQAFDLETDRLDARLADLAQSRELEECTAAVATLEAQLTAHRQRREELARAERELAREVEAVATKAKSVEATLYSGTVKIPKELEGLQADLQMLRRRQSELEEIELQQLEAIETVEADMATSDVRRAEAAARAAEIETASRSAEAEIRSELVRIEQERAKAVASLPRPVLDAYARLRGDRRLGGRAAVPFGAGVCEGCRIQLPTSEYGRIRAEPPDAVVCCAGCGRILVR